VIYFDFRPMLLLVCIFILLISLIDIGIFFSDFKYYNSEVGKSTTKRGIEQLSLPIFSTVVFIMSFTVALKLICDLL